MFRVHFQSLPSQLSSTMDDDFRVENVDSRVKTLINEKGDAQAVWEECRDVFMETIYDWSDYYTEALASESESEEALRFRSKLINLWQLYSSFEANNKQFKKAVDVLKKATIDPIVGNTAQIFVVFAEYYQSKDKPASAQRVFIDGLCKGLPEIESATLWRNLLSFTQNVASSSEITYEKLYEEIVTSGIESGQTLSFPPECDTAALAQIKVNYIAPKSVQQEVAESKSNEVEPIVVARVQAQAIPAVKVPHSTQLSSYNSAPQPVQQIHLPIRWSDGDAMGGWSAEQILSVFRSRPAGLMCAPTKEPMVSGVSSLTSTEKLELELYLGAPFYEAEGHPKARDTLDILEAMWYRQALRERDFDAWITRLNQIHSQEEASILAHHHQMSQAAHMQIMTCRQRAVSERALIHAFIHKCLFDLLVEQVGILYSLRFPRLTALFGKQLENWTLQAQKKPVSATEDKELQVINQEIQKLQKLVCAVLSLRRHQLQPSLQQAPEKLAFKREMSTEDDEFGTGTPGGERRRAKRRRSVLSPHSSSPPSENSFMGSA